MTTAGRSARTVASITEASTSGNSEIPAEAPTLSALDRTCWTDSSPQT